MQTLRAWAWPHIPLIILAFATMMYSHATFDPDSDFSWSAVDWFGGFLYAAAGITILFAHEMGHYLTAKRYNVRASRPYFLPGIPVGLPGLVMPFIGTFGAFIKMELAPMSRSALMRIAALGPVAGFVIAVPVLFAGFSLSDIQPVPENATFLGDTLLILIGESIFFPEIPEGHDVFLHPLAMAGWMGCLLTAINLLPIGQLDGGHIAYALFGKVWNNVAVGVGASMVLLGVFAFAGWFVLGGFILLFGWRHPDTTTESTLDSVDIALGVFSVLMFVLCFSPAPIEGHSLIDVIQSF